MRVDSRFKSRFKVWVAALAAAMALGLNGPAAVQAQQTSAAAPPAVARGRALFVGVGDYEDSRIPRLPSAPRDARALSQVFGDAKRSAFGPANVRLLSTDPKDAAPATKTALEAGLKWLSETPPDQVALFYFSGHGMIRGMNHYLAPADTQLGLYQDPLTRKTKTTGTPETLLDIQDVNRYLNANVTNRRRYVMVILDSCHSGAGTGTPLAMPVARRTNALRLARWQPSEPLSARVRAAEFQNIQAGTKKLSPGQLNRDSAAVTDALLQMKGASDQALLASCDSDQESFESDKLGRGVFSYYLQRGLEGEADGNNDGVVDLFELHTFTRGRVSDYVRQYERVQTPRYQCNIGPVLGLTRATKSIDDDLVADAPLKLEIARPVLRSGAGGALETEDYEIGGRGLKIAGIAASRSGVARVRVELLGADGKLTPVQGLQQSGLTSRNLEPRVAANKWANPQDLTYAPPSADRRAGDELHFEQEVPIQAGTKAVVLTAYTPAGQKMVRKVQLKPRAPGVPRKHAVGVVPAIAEGWRIDQAEAAVIENPLTPGTFIKASLRYKVLSGVTQRILRIVAADGGFQNVETEPVYLDRLIRLSMLGQQPRDPQNGADGLIYGNIDKFFLPQENNGSLFIGVTLIHADARDDSFPQTVGYATLSQPLGQVVLSAEEMETYFDKVFQLAFADLKEKLAKSGLVAPAVLPTTTARAVLLPRLTQLP